MFDFSRSSLDSIKSLGELTNLRDLRLCCLRNPPSNEAMDALCSSLKNLACFSSLRSLVLMGLVCLDSHFDAWCRSSLFPSHLQRLHLEGCLLPRIQEWITELHNLYSLKLTVREVLSKADGIGILAGLPSLFHLRLTIVQNPAERIVIPVNDMAFQVLKHLEFQCLKTLPAFEVGAMPRLQRLHLWLNVVGWKHEVGQWLIPVGIREIHIVNTEHDGADKCKMAAAESALRSVLDMHHPGVDLTIF
ncbi:hypothetical protein QOZ80_5AG0384750 [Eleusine coracana subsp. coracana]|nr:hypothetical protein QOZ80_5AG0384750 [Eleusine coracana subsp. coracana]